MTETFEERQKKREDEMNLINSVDHNEFSAGVHVDDDDHSRVLQSSLNQPNENVKLKFKLKRFYHHQKRQNCVETHCSF